MKFVLPILVLLSGCTLPSVVQPLEENHPANPKAMVSPLKNAEPYLETSGEPKRITNDQPSSEPHKHDHEEEKE